jgi:Heterokaryon incompatibility protein (HET)
MSHCWGTTGRPLTTEKPTIDSRHERIRFEDLSRGFQDVVTISRAVKIRYLWIDTLCIIQDSIEDWAAESAQRARIYKSSCLTISFTDYKDSHQPIFCGRLELPTCRMGGEMPNIYIRSIFPSSQQEPSKILEHSYTILGNLSCLGHRAWAFPERLLSPRVLNYTRDQLIWECGDGVKHESMVAVDKSYMNMVEPKSKKKDIYQFWLSLMETLSQCDLTYSEDIFPTLSGIASETKALLDDIYIAGMWKSDLHVALLWRPGKYCSVVDKYRAPSWSWAS